MPDQNRRFRIGLVADHKATVGEVKDVTFTELTQLVCRHTISPVKYGRGWTPAEFEPGPRTKERAGQWGVLVLDIEGRCEGTGTDKRLVGPAAPALDSVADEIALADWSVSLATSWSHEAPSPDGGTIGPRYRILVETSRSLTPGDEVESLARCVATMLGLRDVLDTAAMDPSRLFFFASAPADRISLARSRVVEGTSLDVDELLPTARLMLASEAFASPPKAGNTNSAGSVISAFNASYEIGALLEHRGYKPRGRSRWLSPHSSSGMAGIVLLDDGRLFCHHPNDPLHSAYTRDAFDVWTVLEHGGDQRSAVRAAAKMFEMTLPSMQQRGSASIAGPLDPVEQIALNNRTQDAVAAVFVNRFAGKLLFAHGIGSWHRWDGCRWKADSTNVSLHFAREVCREANDENRAGMGSLSFAAGVEAFARADPRLAIEAGLLNADHYLLNTPSGTIDLRSNTLRPPDQEDLLTCLTAVAPQSGTAVTFMRFMTEITNGDEELVEFHQMSLGACLSGAIEAHWMLFWIGSGRNGKNTLGELIAFILGDYTRKIPHEFLMSRKYGGHPVEVANLQGCRLAVSSEVDESAFWDEARINECTGDETLSARRMYGNPFTFRRTHKHLIFGNHRPQLRSVAGGIRSRIKLVPFPASFLGREDSELQTKLRAEAGMVLSWLLDGHRKWLEAERKLPPCRAVEAETTDYFASQSTTEMWISERMLCAPDDGRSGRQWPKASELYSDYSCWKRDRGEIPVSMTRWTETMSRTFRRVQSDGARYVGAILKERPTFSQW